MISLGSLGYVCVAVASPALLVADIGYNVEKTLDVLREAVQVTNIRPVKYSFLLNRHLVKTIQRQRFFAG